MHFGQISRFFLTGWLLATFGCATGPSFEKFAGQLRDHASSTANDCGIARLNEPRSGVIACAQTALANGTPFVAIFQMQGIDSEIFEDVAVNPASQIRFTRWDSDVSGGSAFPAKRRIFEEECRTVKIVDSRQAIECSASGPAANSQ